MTASVSDIRKIDTTGLTVVCDHFDMKVWNMGDGRIVRAGDRTRSLKDARNVFEIYDAAYRASGVTPKAYEVVLVDDSYGVVVDWVQGFSIATHLRIGSYTPEEAGKALGEITLLTHRARLHMGYDVKALYLIMAERIAPRIPSEQAQRLTRLIQDIPERDTMLHGDIHPGNVVVNKSGLHLIDMDTVGFGHAVFDLACLEAFVFRAVIDKLDEYNMTLEACTAAAETVWDAALRRYFFDWNENDIATVRARIEILARLTRCIGSPMYLNDDTISTEYWMQENIEPFRALLRETLPHVDRLDF